MADVVEDFFGCYLLVSENPKFKGRTYIGFTVDPVRRLKQHNAGCAKGGARRTSQRGPWVMVLLVQGFPNQISALRFEWAWQHPERSRRLQGRVDPKKSREKSLDYYIRIAAEMLRIGPWERLPLTLRWIRPDLAQFPTGKDPPVHMPIVYGPVKSVKLPKNLPESDETLLCSICFTDICAQDSSVKCISAKCSAASHISCLATHFLARESQKLLPISGNCPVCDLDTLWGDIIRKKLGCYAHLS